MVAVVLGIPALAVVFVGAGLFPVPVVLPKRTKLRIRDGKVMIYRQPFYTNGWLWMAVVFGIMTVGVVGQVA
ncbi:hypothetical protein G3I15_52455, partial [Streptomyces sp. SID10244]|nr:hypothetical protein [Streptomyces sp. SID10244]